MFDTVWEIAVSLCGSFFVWILCVIYIKILGAKLNRMLNNDIVTNDLWEVQVTLVSSLYYLPILLKLPQLAVCSTFFKRYSVTLAPVENFWIDFKK